MSDPGDEIVIVVDSENMELGNVPRREMRQRRLIHRASYILVFNQRDELFVQKRTKIKDVYPGFYDIAAGGVVLAGETYEESAARELYEELGIKVNCLSRHFDHFHEDKANRVWGRVFSCRSDGPFVLQKEEVEDGFFVSLTKVFEMSSKEPFTPDGLDILNRFGREIIERRGFF